MEAKLNAWLLTPTSQVLSALPPANWKSSHGFSSTDTSHSTCFLMNQTSFPRKLLPPLFLMLVKNITYLLGPKFKITNSFSIPHFLTYSIHHKPTSIFSFISLFLSTLNTNATVQVLIASWCNCYKDIVLSASSFSPLQHILFSYQCYLLKYISNLVQKYP